VAITAKATIQNRLDQQPGEPTTKYIDKSDLKAVISDLFDNDLDRDSAVAAQISSITSAATTLAGRVTTNEGNIATLQGSTTSLTNRVTVTESDIVTIQNSLSNKADLGHSHTVGNITGLAASATTDTTNAANITTGLLPRARLQAPITTGRGGVQISGTATNVYRGNDTWSNIGAADLPIPAANTRGGVALPSPVNAAQYYDGTGNWSVPSVSVPTATALILGGIKVGSGLTIDGDGLLSANPGSIETASADTLGGIKVGSGLTIDGNGTLSANPGAISVATASTLGGVKVASGSGLSVDGTGFLSAIPYNLPTASDAVSGGVKVGGNLSIDGNGILTANLSSIEAQQSANTANIATLQTDVANRALLGHAHVPGDITGLAASATIDTTNAANITTGIIPNARLNLAGVGSRGAVPGHSNNVNQVLKGNLTWGAITAADLPLAAASSAGAVALPAANANNVNLYYNANGTFTAPTFTLPTASSSVVGGIKVGSGLTIDGNSILSATTPPLSIATATILGGIKVGSGLTIDGVTGVLSTVPYTLPTATTSVLGGIKIGSGLAIDGSGVVSADTSSLNTRLTTAEGNITTLTTAINGSTNVRDAANLTTGTISAARIPLANSSNRGAMPALSNSAADVLRGTGVWSPISSTDLPNPTNLAKGGVQISGTATNVYRGNNTWSDITAADIPLAGAGTKGGIQLPNPLDATKYLNGAGVFSTVTPTIPTASAGTPGVVRVGQNLSINGGILSADEPPQASTGWSVLDTSTVTVSTTTPTNLVSATIPTATLPYDGNSVEFQMDGQYLNNSGASRSETFEILINGTVVYSDSLSSIASAANIRGLTIKGSLIRRNNNTGVVKFKFTLTASGGPTIGLYGNLSADATRDGEASSTNFTTDWNSPLTLAIRTTLGTADTLATHYVSKTQFVARVANVTFAASKTYTNESPKWTNIPIPSVYDVEILPTDTLSQIQTKFTNSTAGQTIIFRRGANNTIAVHRLDSTSSPKSAALDFKSEQRIFAELLDNGEPGVMLKGSRNISSTASGQGTKTWTNLGNGTWRLSGETYPTWGSSNSNLDPGFPRNNILPAIISNTSATSSLYPHSLCLYNHGGTSTSIANSNSYYIDSTNIYIGFDPNTPGRVIELITTRGPLANETRVGLFLYGLHFDSFGPLLQEGVIHGFMDRLHVEKCTFSLYTTYGIKAGSDAVIRRCKFMYYGQGHVGIGPNGYNSLIEGCEICYGMTHPDRAIPDQAWDTSKSGGSQLIFRNNYFHDTLGKTLWFDVFWRNIIVQFNYFVNINGGPALVAEVGNNITVEGNYFYDAGFTSVWIQSTAFAKIKDNVFIGSINCPGSNHNGIQVQQEQSRYPAVNGSDTPATVSWSAGVGTITFSNTSYDTSMGSLPVHVTSSTPAGTIVHVTFNGSTAPLTSVGWTGQFKLISRVGQVVRLEMPVPPSQTSGSADVRMLVGNRPTVVGIKIANNIFISSIRASDSQLVLCRNMCRLLPEFWTTILNKPSIPDFIFHGDNSIAGHVSRENVYYIPFGQSLGKQVAPNFMGNTFGCQTIAAARAEFANLANTYPAANYALRQWAEYSYETTANPPYSNSVPLTWNIENKPPMSLPLVWPEVNGSSY
jgi:hypothetical protein